MPKEFDTVLDHLMHHDHSCAPNQFYNGYILCPILCICPSECMIPKHDLSRYFAGMGQCGEIQNLVLSHGTSKICSDQILFTTPKQNGCTWDCKITCILIGHIIAIQSTITSEMGRSHLRSQVFKVFYSGAKSHYIMSSSLQPHWIDLWNYG